MKNLWMMRIEKRVCFLVLLGALLWAGAALWVPAAAAAEPEAVEGKHVVFRFDFETLFPGQSKAGEYMFRARTKDGSAKGGEDYNSVGGLFKFFPGNISRRHKLSVKTFRDCREEGDEYFIVRLDNFKKLKLRVIAGESRWVYTTIPGSKEIRGNIIDNYKLWMEAIGRHGGKC